MPAYLAKPDGDARGAVIVIQEAFGVTTYIEDVCRRLAGQGWWALAPALFHRQGAPVFSYDDIQAARPVMGQLSADGITADLEGAFTFTAGAGFATSQTAIIGFCMGGTVAMYGGTLRSLGAAVTFYGGGITQGRFGLPGLAELAPQLTSPWFGAYGDRDQGIPVDEVEELRKAAATAGVPTEIMRYPDADHGFHCDDRPSVFNADAAADAWSRALTWFDRYVGATPPPS
ncbi:MAG: dienelactone hydrolase family protein [Actinomycetota bacterium]|nr:dienelactone hydrolase family protein [Actinomycetota bacterium]